MKYASHFKFLIILFVGLLSSCESDTIDLNPGKDPVYFQFEINNHAWGYFHSGWYIDSIGNFNYYKLPIDWIEPDSDGLISKDDLLSNLHKADSTIYRVSFFELKNQIEKIGQVEEDSFSKTYFPGVADVGVLSLYCYKWNNDQAKYKRILLAQSGDSAKYNLNHQAKEITFWLFTEGSKSGYFIWF